MDGSDEEMTKFYDVYKAPFDKIKTVLEATGTIKQVVLGEQVRVTQYPYALINAEPSPIQQGALGDLLKASIKFSVVLIVRETEPEDWFTEVIKVMGDAVDAVLADRTLGGKVQDCIPTAFAPCEIKMQNKLFYGGAVHFEAWLFYEP